MNKTNFSKKCEILGQIHLFYSDTDEEGWEELFSYADLGFPLAYMVWSGIADAKEVGENYINETWSLTCKLINVDEDGEYEDVKSFFDASPNPRVDDEDED